MVETLGTFPATLGRFPGLSEASPALSEASPGLSEASPGLSEVPPGLWEASPGVLGKLPRNSGKPEGRGGWRLLELEALGGGRGTLSLGHPAREGPGLGPNESPAPPPNPPGAQLPRLPRVSSTPSKPSQELSAQLPRLPQPMCAKPVRNKLFSADTALPRQLSSLSPASSHNVLCTLFYSVLLLLPRANTDLHQCPGHAPSKSLGFENARNHPGAVWVKGCFGACGFPYVLRYLCVRHASTSCMYMSARGCECMHYLVM